MLEQFVLQHYFSVPVLYGFEEFVFGIHAVAYVRVGSGGLQAVYYVGHVIIVGE